METYSTEEQQIAAIKRFAGEYATKVLAIVVLLVVGVLSYQWFQNDVQSKKESASLYFSELNKVTSGQSKLDINQQTVFDTNFSALLKEYPDSGYASYASLLKARLDVDNEDLDAAVANLQWVVEAGFNINTVDLAELRLARLAFTKGDLEGALAMLDGYKGTFIAQYLTTKADILIAKGDDAAALEAYQAVKALNDMNAQQASDLLLNMKIDTLAANQNATLYPVANEAVNNEESK